MYNLGFVILIFIFSIVSLASSVLFKLTSREKNDIYSIASILIFMCGLWYFGVGMLWLNINNPQKVIFWTKVSCFGSIIGVVFLIFIYSFFEKRLKLITEISLFAIAIIFSLFALLKIGKENETLIKLFVPVGPRDFLRMLNLGLVSYGLFYGIKNFKKLKGIKKLQFQYVLAGLGIYLVLSLVFITFLPYILKTQNLFMYLPVFSFVWIVPIIYSLYYKKLVSFDTIVCDFITSIIFSSSFILIYFIFLTLFKKVFFVSEIFSNILSLSIVSLIFFSIPLKERFSCIIKQAMLKKRINYEYMLIDCSKKVTSILDIDKLFDYVTNTLVRAFGIKKICFFLRENFSDKEIKYKLYKFFKINGYEFKPSIYFSNIKILNWLKKHKDPFILDREYLDLSKKDFEELTFGLPLIDTILVVPITNKEQLLGFIILDQKHIGGNVFDIDDIQLIQGLTNQLGIAVENAMLYKELDDAYINITRALSIAVEIKEGYTLGHSDNVTKYAIAIAKKMNLSTERVILIAQSAMLHDLGKIGIPDHILIKPGKLTDEEWNQMKEHPIKGAKILEPLPFMKDVIDIVKHHHERYNGGGYPDDLKKEKIPIGAQILSVADAFDAMISSRPYRMANGNKFTLEQATQELFNNKGNQFNPEIVDMFIEILKENPNIVRITNSINVD